MVTHSTVWANTNSENAARKVYGWLQHRLGRETEHLSFEPYWKIEGCWIIGFQIALSSTTWNDAVVEAIGLGQRIGRGWILSGDVYSQLDGWSNEPSVPGVRALHWQLASAWPEGETARAYEAQFIQIENTPT